ncbi:cytochrome P450 2C29-like [Diaphorina citri]|uniref:Cytochrome P450 2C29-like n=1 Tax=Diaphorina citri TaxID=121845 RepID=A0A1S4E6P1_DIACI|nr:cytochrome P450 2C29-like [Diaphorina citri]
MLQKKAFEALQNFFRESIHEHRATLDPDHPRDLYDAYLIEQKNAQETGIDVDLWSEENLIILSSDIFSATCKRTRLDRTKMVGSTMVR